VKNLLERYIILKLLSRNGTSVYEVRKKMIKLGYPIAISRFYDLIKVMKKEKLIDFIKSTVPVKQLSKHGKSGNGWWYSRTKETSIYSPTSDGIKEMFTLGFRINIALTCTVNGEEP
jgi:hypothetical protein